MTTELASTASVEHGPHREQGILHNARLVVGALWIVFQLYVVFEPQAPLTARPIHLVFALLLAFAWAPLPAVGFRNHLHTVADLLILAATLAAGAYYVLSSTRLTERMEAVDPVYGYDIAFGIVIVALLLEGVRRTVGWPLLGVLLLFLIYSAFGPSFPGWLEYSGFRLDQIIEILTMSLNGVLGITTATSLEFVFYFVLFGAVYGAVGGGQLFIDIGLRLSGRRQGGAAKAAVISSSIMGSVSGSAVANVAATGVFTIPLMRRAGYSRETAGAIEAIASTGGQLMPPIMGVAAFVMAEILQVDYVEVAMAGLIPAVAFYLAIFLIVDLEARKTKVGTLPAGEKLTHIAIRPRLYLLVPPVVLVAVLVSGKSATLSALIATGTSVAICFLRRQSWLSPRDIVRVIGEGTRQAAQVAVPISAIGIIIAVAIQSNLALKFSSELIQSDGGTQIGAMLMIILGCLVMGMGLPTVAAYIIGAILFVPALRELGVAEMPAHFFVMYYCVLSMVTPPVALASYTAAGLAEGNTMRTSLLAFRLGFVSFLIPFAFVFDPRLLALGSGVWTLAALGSLMAGTAAWAVALAGYLHRRLTVVERILFACAAVGVIFSPTGSTPWLLMLLILGTLFGIVRLRQSKPSPGQDNAPLETHL